MPFADTIEYSPGHLMVIVAPNPDIRGRAVQALAQSGIQWSSIVAALPTFADWVFKRLGIQIRPSLPRRRRIAAVAEEVDLLAGGTGAAA
jgi:hypothetical protein